MRMVNVSKCLDKRLILFGFEVLDLLSIFVVLSILNLTFGGASGKIFFVWLPTLVLALVLYFGKKGKPEKYLIHLLRFQVRPGFYSAFQDPTDFELCPRLKEKK